MGQLVRIFANPQLGERSFHKGQSVTFTLFIDDDGHCVSEDEMGGVTGKGNEHVYPFIFNPETCEIDFGTTNSEESRYYFTDITQTPIKINRAFFFGPKGTKNVPEYSMIIRNIRVVS